MSEHSRDRNAKPRKPYRDFPLFPHANGSWCKKIKGKLVFFGGWSDPHAALEKYMAEREALYAGTAPPAPTRRAPAPVSPSARARVSATVAPTKAKDAARANVAQRVATQPPPSASEPPFDADEDGGTIEVPALRLAGTLKEGSIEPGAGLTVRDIVNAFLTAKERRLEAGEMGMRSFSEQHATGKRLIQFLGKNKLVRDIVVDDFARLRASVARTRGPVALGNEIGRVRSIFKHAYESELIEKPIRFGPEFKKPSKKAVRIARRASGPKMFEPNEIALLLEAAGVQMKAMILLGINCGFGNTDISELTRSNVNLKNATIDFPRPKTGIARRCPLWPETIAALREVAKARPTPKDAADRNAVFITKQKNRWVRVTEPGARSQGKRQAVVKDNVAAEFTKVAKAAGVLKARRGFYALRHTFRTVADEVGDRKAIDLIMGHENGADIATAYIEHIGEDRLQKVVDHVRTWMYGKSATA